MTTPTQSAPAEALHHSVAVRFAVLLGVLLAGLTAVFLVIRTWEQSEADQLAALAQRQQTTQLERWLVLSRRSLETFAGELTRHPEPPRLLVAESFLQRAALRREIEQHTLTAASLRRNREELRRTLDDRAHLARDLHDGIIQSLYAAGMSLAGIRALLLPEQLDAASRLEQTRGALNESIRDMRNFITGLEPETLREQSFAQAISALLDFMQSVRSFRATSEIDDTAASRLSLAQRLHAVQIAREAVSNALRHGEAASVSVALRIAGDTIVFEVRDDGRGFVPGATPSVTGSGHGLTNFQRRARELGADLVLLSEVGRGTTVQLIFTSPP